MGLIYFESFDSLVGGVGLGNLHFSGYTMSWEFVTGRGGTGSALRYNAMGAPWVTTVGSSLEWTVGFATQRQNNGNNFIDIYGGNGTLASLFDVGDGRLAMSVGCADLGTQTWTSTYTAHPNVWYYIEMSVKVAGTGGVLLAINDEIVLNTQATFTDVEKFPYANIVLFGGPGGGNNCTIDDLYVANEFVGSNTSTIFVGLYEFTHFWGDAAIGALLPAADTTNTGWQTSTGTSHYACVDDPVANGYTDYVWSITPGVVDVYTLNTSTATATFSAIDAVQIVCNLRKMGAGTRVFVPLLVPGFSTSTCSGSDYTHASGEWTSTVDVFSTNPVTGTFWDASEVVASKLGLKIVS